MSEKKFMLSLHRRMWKWLAENQDKQKESWPEWKENGGKIENVVCSCFCCEYNGGNNCDECPLVWPGGRCCFGSGKGTFDLYERAKGEERSRLALEIANLPVKSGVFIG